MVFNGAFMEQYAYEQSAAKIEKLSVADDDHIGLEILHLFVVDVLGRETAAAHIFKSKTAEDFKHTQVVTRRSKSLAVFALIAINLFFIYYTMASLYPSSDCLASSHNIGPQFM